jgi:DUF4097 and DUF4098 domain-containing protein YvlB
MPSFDTPDPISVTLELGVGDVRIVAGERADTIGRLTIKAPKGWRQWTFRGVAESIDVRIDLPAGSHVRGEAGIGAFRCTGRLGECHLKTGIGELHLEHAGPAELRTGIGDIIVDHADDHAELTTGSGVVQIASLDGTAVVKNANGDTWIGEATGDLRVNAANGRITVDHAHAGVAAKTANGDVHLGEVAQGAVLAQTGLGKLDIAIRAGVPAWLDLDTHFGNVHNGLDAAGPPQPDEATVEIRARTAFGDITINRRSPVAADDPPPPAAGSTATISQPPAAGSTATIP